MLDQQRSNGRDRRQTGPSAGAEREAQFLELREEIERIASDIFDGDTIDRGAVVRVFAKHIRK
jgi:hypothetical protein